MSMHWRPTALPIRESDTARPECLPRGFVVTFPSEISAMEFMSARGWHTHGGTLTVPPECRMLRDGCDVEIIPPVWAGDAFSITVSYR